MFDMHLLCEGTMKHPKITTDNTMTTSLCSIARNGAVRLFLLFFFVCFSFLLQHTGMKPTKFVYNVENFLYLATSKYVQAGE